MWAIPLTVYVLGVSEVSQFNQCARWVEAVFGVWAQNKEPNFFKQLLWGWCYICKGVRGGTWCILKNRARKAHTGLKRKEREASMKGLLNE